MDFACALLRPLPKDGRIALLESLAKIPLMHKNSGLVKRRVIERGGRLCVHCSASKLSKVVLHGTGFLKKD